MPLSEKVRDDIWSAHAKLHEFSMHRDEDMNLSLFCFYEFCTLEEQELWRITYMKEDVVLYEGVPTKFVSSFFGALFYFLWSFKLQECTSV
jgi:hypothetical protein